MLQVVKSGNKKWKVSDQFPIWFVELVARTRQYHVFPVSSAVPEPLYVWLLMSNPVSVQLVTIIRLGESNVLVVSISTEYPPTVTPLAEKFQVRLGVVSGAMLIPVSTAQEPFVGVTGTGSDGSASEPGT